VENFIKDIIANLVENKDEIEVILQNENDTQVVYELKVSKEEVGKVIGKNGKTINAIRTIMKATNFCGNKKVALVINQ
jgi:predicted RNA-binding protein YlqC (UPF0109 family)